MSLSDDLLIILSSYSGAYRLLHAKIHGYPTHSRLKRKPSLKGLSDASARVTLSRLKQRGLVENEKGIWRITKKGREYLSRKLYFLPPHSEMRLGRKPKNMIIVFDIPEIHKHKRNWLRVELVRLGFSMLQKSVWLGPTPLPQEFLDAFRELDILPHLKFFEAKETDVV